MITEVNKEVLESVEVQDYVCTPFLSYKNVEKPTFLYDIFI